MKLYCLSGNPNRPCFVLKFKQTTIMFDCGVDVSSLLHFVPLCKTHSERIAKLPGWMPGNTPRGTKLDDEIKECGGRLFVDSEPELLIPEIGMIDMSEVDVILLSNYHCFLALPYITEYTNFKGEIYATDPTLHFGRLFMEEMVTNISGCPKPGRASKWKQPFILAFLPPPLRDVVHPVAWKQCYNKHDVASCVSKVKTVGFNEKLDFFGSLSLMATSSGFCIGSSNWIINSQYEKIGYVSGSSTWTTHPRAMEQSSLKNCDVLIMCGLTQSPSANPDTMMGEFCINTAMTLKNGGNVLVPCYASGVTFDLLECLSRHLESCGLAQIPMYFLSPVADDSLAYSNIYAEWLSPAKQNKVYLPEYPFPHSELVKSNWLKHFPSLDGEFSQSLKSPCVVFAGHPSLRFGDVVHLIELWGKSSGNTLIITEPDYPYLEALAPYQPLAMKVCFCPIDTSLSFVQANKLIKDLKPHHLVISEQYNVPPPMQNNESLISYEPPPVLYKRGQVLNLPIKRKYQKIELDHGLAGSIVPIEIRPGIAAVTLSGDLACKDSHHVLTSLFVDNNPELKTKSKKRRLQCGIPYPGSNVWGTPNVKEFVNQLGQHGLGDAKIEECPDGHIVILPDNDDILIQLEGNSTHIICNDNEEVRVKIRDALLKCLTKI